jgi:hypothetical protein
MVRPPRVAAAAENARETAAHAACTCNAQHTHQMRRMHSVAALTPTPPVDPTTRVALPARCSQLLEPLLLQAGNSSGPPATSLEQLLTRLQPPAGNGPCTAVWTSGTVAYRCKTCAVSNSSAVRVFVGRAS